ncbi:MAG TPA: helix-turn-helix transcriptional regulator [Gemmatimonadaceae bacterium]|nr:helix-turn-helix transcriptional regulator [Gemmatimonadaceae bacterium]
MSTRKPGSKAELLGVPELIPLGKHIEVLRIGRGLSKQHLARFAGTSRQQLWRVMTGKSELTDALGQRLAHALQVETSQLFNALPGPSVVSSVRSIAGLTPPSIGISLETYLAGPALVERSLRTLPNGEAGRELKRALLTALEDLSIHHHVALPAEFFDLRRRVLAEEL